LAFLQRACIQYYLKNEYSTPDFAPL